MINQDEKAKKVHIVKRKAIIAAQACFAELSNDENTNLAELLHEVQYDPKSVIVKEGDLIDSVYFIVKGSAEVKHITYEQGQQQTQIIATLQHGDTIGLNDVGFYSITGKRTATVTAKTEILLLKLNLAVFHGFSLVNHHVNKVMRKNAEKILQMKNP